MFRGMDKEGILNKKAVSRFLLFVFLVGFLLTYNLFNFNLVFGDYYSTISCEPTCNAGRFCYCMKFSDGDCISVSPPHSPATVGTYYTQAIGCTTGCGSQSSGPCRTTDACASNYYYCNGLDCDGSGSCLTCYGGSNWGPGCQDDCNIATRNYCNSGTAGGSYSTCASGQVCYVSGSQGVCGDPDSSSAICVTECSWVWLNPPNDRCCGDDGSSDDYASGSDGSNYCCSGSSKVDDTWCDSSFGWQIDGVQCTGDAVDRDGAWTPPTADNDLDCDCDSIGDGDPCASGIADANQDGICARTSGGSWDCDVNEVAYNHVTVDYYQSCAETTIGFACDQDVNPGYSVDGVCTKDDGGVPHICCNGNGVDCVGTTYLDSTPLEYCPSEDSSTPTAGATCDSDVGDGDFDDDKGIWVGTSGASCGSATCDCCTNTYALGSGATDITPYDSCAATCDTDGKTCLPNADFIDWDGITAGELGVCTTTATCTKGLVSKTGADYIAGCSTAGYECDSDIEEASGYVRTGYCLGASCVADGSVSEQDKCSHDAQCSDTTYTRSCYSGNSTTCMGSSGSTDGFCLRDNSQVCTTGYQCGSGVCHGGSCLAKHATQSYCSATTCGDQCSGNGNAWNSGAGQMHGPTNNGCSLNMPLADFNIDTTDCIGGTGDTRDADCQANCGGGLTYITTTGGGNPYLSGQCQTLKTEGQACCQPRGYGGGGSGGGDCAANLNCTTVIGTCKRVDGQSCTNGDECYSDLCIAGVCNGWETDGCDGYTGAGCSEDSNAWNGASGGTCLSDGACDTVNPVRMDCGGSGTSACQTSTDAVYDTCTTTSGDSCDTTTGNGNFTQDGTCASDGGDNCDNSGHVCFDTANYQADCSSCSEGHTCDSSVTGGDYSANGDCFNAAGSLICCYGTQDMNDTNADTQCCYNGDVKADDWNSASAACINGGLYDCGSQISMDEEADADYCSNPESGSLWCGYANTWVSNRINADCCPVVDAIPNSTTCPIIDDSGQYWEWNDGSTSTECAVNKWLIQDTDDSGGNDDIWGVWAQNNTYGLYILLNISSGTPAGNLRIYIDTDESAPAQCYANSTGIYQVSGDTPCTGHPNLDYASSGDGYAEYRIDLDYACGSCCGGGGSCPQYLYLYVEDPNADNDRAPDSGYAEYNFACGGGGPSVPIPEFIFGAITAFVILLFITYLFAPKPL